jgi:hypothetical protein
VLADDVIAEVDPAHRIKLPKQKRGAGDLPDGTEVILYPRTVTWAGRPAAKKT